LPFFYCPRRCRHYGFPFRICEALDPILSDSFAPHYAIAFRCTCVSDCAYSFSTPPFLAVAPGEREYFFFNICGAARRLVSPYLSRRKRRLSTAAGHRGGGGFVSSFGGGGRPGGVVGGGRRGLCSFFGTSISNAAFDLCLERCLQTLIENKARCGPQVRCVSPRAFQHILYDDVCRSIVRHTTILVYFPFFQAPYGRGCFPRSSVTNMGSPPEVVTFAAHFYNSPPIVKDFSPTPRTIFPAFAAIASFREFRSQLNYAPRFFELAHRAFPFD